MIPDGTKVKVVGCQEGYLKKFIGFVGIAHELDRFAGLYWMYYGKRHLILPEEYLEEIQDGH